MAEHPVVGPLFSSHLIEEAVIANLRKWLPGYLTVACEEHGVDEGIAAIKSWGLGSSAERWPEQGFPALLVVGGPARDVEKNGESYRAKWPFEVGIAVRGDIPHKARMHAQVYAAAVRGAILQRRSLGSQLRSADWEGEDPAEGHDDQKRTVAAVSNSFVVFQENVVFWKRGPGSSDGVIPDRWPMVKETHVETEIQDP
ncbi:MAG TPA: hypothetical protein VFX35_01625 [Solirubrobacterales bacterium]|nr:hypothetical protein [Solirubrobacterales bacterium]